MSAFAARLVAWHAVHGRHDLPWQGTRDPYAIWVSEIMLQQTQVATVIPYYRRFLEDFPDVATLAAASLDHVLARWSGLGYYTRARNLHRAAQFMMRDHGGHYPRAFEAVLNLPGIGRSTAAAICVFAFGARRAILDGNVKRVLARHFGIRGYPGDKTVEATLWSKAKALLPRTDLRAYTQALMDLGAGICSRRRPRCGACPVASRCVAYRKNLIAELPAPRPRKPLPHRTSVMPVLEYDGKLLLERRPTAGIWGGLWCFPECAAESDVVAECSRRYGVRIARATRLDTVAHGFTHFRLTIEPWRLCVSRLSSQASEPGTAWLSFDEAHAAAVPAPVRRILLQLEKR